ncbi:MAG: UDP-glucose/GDP-mannose dehydrogenase family protein [Bdellovibrionota bacterium]
MKVTVIGTGYVGLVTGTCLAEVGHNVDCVDSNQEKVQMLQSGLSPIFEPGIERLIKRNVEHERLRFGSDLEHALIGSQLVFIAVGTPEGEDGSADLSHVMAVARSIGLKVKSKTLVVVKSTVPVGTCDLVEEIINKELLKRNIAFEVHVASNPEFLKEGAAIDDFMKPDRIIVGLQNKGDYEEQEVFQELYHPFILNDPGRLMFMNRRASELTKYGSNAMLATRISFMNELSRLCEKVGADIDDIRRGMGADVRIGNKFLYAGPGYGGSCFPKDVEALIKMGEKHRATMSVLTSVRNANLQQKKYAANKIKDYFGEKLSDKSIAVWGLSFKPGTDDVRETPAFTIVEAILDAGANVIAHDPQAIDNFKKLVGERDGLRYVEEAYHALEGVDALVLVTEWSEYKRPNWDKVERLMRGRAIFDFRNQYSSKELKKRSFHYESIGRKEAVKGVEGSLD